MSAEPVRRILLLIPSLQQGGAERVIVTLLQHIDRVKFRCTLAVVDMTAAVYSNDLPADVELIDLQAKRVRGALRKIISLIWRHRPDVVFSTLGHLNLALAILMPILPRGVRYVAREATIVSQLPSAYKLPRWWFWAYRRFYAQLDEIVCQSVAMRDDLVHSFDIPRAKMVVINNPVDAARVQALSSERIDTGMDGPERGVVNLVAAGSLTPVKGFERIIEALALCGRRSLRLTVLGDGPLRNDLLELSASRGVLAQVRFIGYQSNPYVYFARADALVISSHFEGFPNVALESLACGTPVIATPSPGGVREILAGVEGCILADDCSAAALARVLSSFQAGRRIPSSAIEPYAAPSIASRYERLFAHAAVP